MIARIPLTQGKEAVIDAADLPRVAALAWHADYSRAARRWYAVHTRPDDRRLYLHRFLLGAGPDEIVSHVNGDGLDNRRANLRRWRKAKRRGAL
jgi:hypothetical protein